MRRAVAIALVAAVGGCGTRAIIRDSLSANDPGRLDAPAGPPPVDPAALAIAPTGEPPTATPTVDPQVVFPRMDGDFKERKFPAGAGPTLPPATRPSDLLDVPYGRPGAR